MAYTSLKIEQFVEESMVNVNELIPVHTKTIALNNLTNKLNEIRTKTTNFVLIRKINALRLVIEDMYKIDMYKFQFKSASENLVGDIAALKRAVDNAI